MIVGVILSAFNFIVVDNIASADVALNGQIADNNNWGTWQSDGCYGDPIMACSGFEGAD